MQDKIVIEDGQFATEIAEKIIGPLFGEKWRRDFGNSRSEICAAR